jgi:hypothetical protein
LPKIPDAFTTVPGVWFYFQLRDEVPQDVSIDKEFAIFKEAEREQTERVFRQAKILKVVAAGLAVMLFLLVIVFAFYLIRAQKKRSQRGGVATISMQPNDRARASAGFFYSRCSAMAAGEKSSA